MPRNVPWIGLGLFGVLAAAYTAICAFVALTLTRPRRQPFVALPDQYGLAYDDVRFPSRVDAVPLDGWLLRPADAPARRRPVVVVHGRGADRSREADNHMLEIAAGLVRHGRPVLLFDLRASGRSGGNHYTLGTKEVRDVGGAIDFLASLGMAESGVDLLGYSMGGATVLLTAASEPLVRTVVEDSAYAELGELIESQVPKASHLPAFFTPGMALVARPLVGMDVYAIRPIDHVGALAARGVPLLVIHGEDDTTVPFSHAQRIAAAYGPSVKTLFVSDAGHVRSYAADPARYLETIDTFLDAASTT